MDFFKKNIKLNKYPISIHSEKSDDHDSYPGTEKEVIQIFSPTAGKIIPLEQVEDEVFSKGIMGKGIGILPMIPMIYSPISGVIKYIAQTNHALIISANSGLEILIHVGLDTVELKGKFFQMYIHKDDHVNVGDPLLKFNLKAIEKSGYSIVVPVIITNSTDYSRIELVNSDSVNISESLIKVFKRR